jgi:hypothetical protein
MRVLGRKALSQPRWADQHVRGYMKAIPNLTHHGHAEFPFPGHDLADPTGRPQRFSELHPRQAMLVHQIGQKLRECGRPTAPTALLVRLDQSWLGDEARFGWRSLSCLSLPWSARCARSAPSFREL